MQLIVSRVALYEQQPAKAPGWFAGLHWEDVLVGLLLHEYAQPMNKPDRKPSPARPFTKRVHDFVDLANAHCQDLEIFAFANL